MNTIFQTIRKYKLKTIAFLFLAAWAMSLACNTTAPRAAYQALLQKDTSTVFTPPDTSAIPHDEFGDMVRYGRDLIVNTARYIGPHGTAGHYLGNKMNCTNCHLDAGTRPFGNSFFSTHARYPQYRGRENKVISLSERVNNCIERPHNGIPMPLDSKEMIAIVSYIKWLGSNVPVGQHVKGDEGMELTYPTRAADPAKGEIVYDSNCSSCHGKNGAGQWNVDSTTYIYPPLWGSNAYQVGSSPSRVLKLARFVKANMPDKKTSWQKPLLTDEQCIDVAAFVNDERIHPRPEKKDKSHPDYPNIKTKAIDYEIGPYIDTFSAIQHKFGPYQPIIDYHKANNLPVIF